MLEAVLTSAHKSSVKKRNNRKRDKVFDPCISNKKKKMNNELYCNQNSSLELNNQFATIKNHLIFDSKKDLNRTMDELCNDLGLAKYVSEDELSDDPEFGVHYLHKSNNSVEGCLNKIFEGLDDYATFNVNGMSTPKESRKVYSGFDSCIKPTPGLIIGNSSNPRAILRPSNENITSELDNIFTNITPHNGKTRISISSTELNLSTPQNTLRTPFKDMTNAFQTPEQLNDMSRHPSRSSPQGSLFYVQSPVRDPFTTPCSTPRQSNKISMSPDIIELPPEIKRTLLVGVVCFVDVKTNKEDCSSSVALELLSMGANVEKTFNKKVTHVIFKEGKLSTYLKAKKLEITVVSVLWIEACKKELKMVDPTLYPPINVEKYESISPNGKRLPTLKTIQRKLRKHLLREAGLLSAENKSKSKVRINWRNAVTDIKMRPSGSSQENSQGKLCTKKLDFQKTDQQNIECFTNDKAKLSQINGSIVEISDSPDIESLENNKNKDNSGNSSDNQISPPVLRRKSAPAKFVSGGKKRKRKEEPELITESQNKCMTIDKLFAKQMALTEAKKVKMDSENADSGQSSQISSAAGRKRKLFNPDSAITIIDSPDGKVTPPPIVYGFPYADEVTATRKPRTKSTSMRKIFKKFVMNKKPVAMRSLTSLLEQEEASNTRNSLTFFVDPKKNEPKVPKGPPTIVCTSLLPEEVRKVAYITGKLGVFDVEVKVSSKTTHLVTSSPRRTVNLLKALVRGAWILHIDWLHKSEKAGYWLNEEEFELKTFSHAVLEMRRERQAFGSEFCSELFSKCGPMYISHRSVPPCADLSELVQLCKGRVVTHISSAQLVIGGRAVVGETVTRLKEKWLLDSITQNTLLDMDRYMIFFKTEKS